MITTWVLFSVLTIGNNTGKLTKTDEYDSSTCVRHASLEWGSFYKMTDLKKQFYASCVEYDRSNNKAIEHISVKCDRDGLCSNKVTICHNTKPIECN